MSYFNHAFKKTFIGTGDGFNSTVPATINLQTGEFGFYDPKTWVNYEDAPTNGCPLVLVAGSIHTQDNIGPFAGGYTESVKSKTINPKYVSKFYRVDPCDSQSAQITVGSNSVSVNTEGEAPAGWCNLNSGSAINREFACNSTYNLRVDIKGSPALRFLTRNSYYTAAAYTGCCPDGVDGIGANVNPLIVYVQWAYQLLNSPLINPFIQVQITYTLDYTSGVWAAIGDGTNSAANLELLLGYINNPSTLPDVVNYPTGSPTSPTPGYGRAGLIINGAYVDTQFLNCTFYPSDSIIALLEPVKIYASEVDLNGDPCAFGGVCVSNTCPGYQGTGYGETVLRDLIMTEAYMQQPFYTGKDLRIREITNGDDAYNVIDRSSKYYRYYIQHSVPRFNNPTGTFDNDQYLLEIITSQANSSFENYVEEWLSNAGSSCVGLETYSCPAECTLVSPVEGD